LPVARDTPQEQLNSYILSRTVENLGLENATVSELSFERINDIAVATYRSESGASAHLVRVAHIRLGNRPTHMFIACGGTMPLSEQDLANFRAVLASLEFGAGAAGRAAEATPLARSQASTRAPGPSRMWRHPAAQFSIHVPEAWVVDVSDEGLSYLHNSMSATAPARQGGQSAASCSVGATWRHNQIPSADQESLNAYYAGRRGAHIEQDMVDGVRVMTLNQSSDDRYSRTRIFLLPLEGRAREHVIACSVRRVGGDGAPLDVEQGVADAEGLLNSLSFAAGESP
jgi:hypothetical protein